MDEVVAAEEGFVVGGTAVGSAVGGIVAPAAVAVAADAGGEAVVVARFAFASVGAMGGASSAVWKGKLQRG